MRCLPLLLLAACAAPARRRRNGPDDSSPHPATNQPVRFVAPLLLALLAACAAPARVAIDGPRFTLDDKPWTPWGFNYDHDSDSKLMEEYWEKDWARLAGDFREMKALGATVVRIHLQLSSYLKSPTELDLPTLDRLSRLLTLAEEVGLHLDLTGACSYRKSATPAWYAEAPEAERWAMQARFWEAVASRAARSPAVFCYTLMNEPVSPAGPGKELWAGELGGFRFVENLTLDPGKRDRHQVTREWMSRLIPGIRKHDPKALVTCGSFFLFDTPRGYTLGPDVKEATGPLDFVSVHLYPKEGKVEASIEQLKVAAATGKPVVIQEMFPLSCGMPAFKGFLDASREHAAGWISFYWGKTILELKASGQMKDAMLAAWLEFILAEGPRFRS